MLIGSEDSKDPLHVIGTTHVLAVPRQMGIEYQLSRLPAEDVKLEQVEKMCERFLVQLSQNSPEVGPPFHFVRVTADGLQFRAQR
jgi:hypothetical protein